MPPPLSTPSLRPIESHPHSEPWLKKSNNIFLERSRRVDVSKGSKGGPRKECNTIVKIPQRRVRGDQRTLHSKGPEQITNHWTGQNLRQDETKTNKQHGSIACNRKQGKAFATTEIKQKIRHLRDGRMGHHLPMGTTPLIVNQPAGKLESHICREAGMSCRSLDISKAVSRSTRRLPRR